MHQTKRRKTLRALLCSLPLLAGLGAAAHAQDKIASAAQRAAIESGSVRVIIQTRADTSFRDGGNAFRRPATYLSKQLNIPARDVKAIGQLPMVVATVTPAGLEQLREDPNVEKVFRDELRHISLYDTVISTGAAQHTEAGYSGKGWVVAVLDSGVDTKHPAFKGAIAGEACFSSNYSGEGSQSKSFCKDGKTKVIGKGAGINCDMSFSDLCSHGTHVAGIVAGRPVKLKNGKTIHGMAPDAKLLVAQIFSGIEGKDCESAGLTRCILAYDSDTLQALEWVYSLRNDFKIASVNMSIGGSGFTEPCDDKVSYAPLIEKLRKAGIATVIATGNEGLQDAVGAPGCVSSAVSVTATDKTGKIDENYANVARFVTIAAPGTQILSSIPGRKVARFDGTSMATPHVAGAFAVLRQEYPEASVSEIVKLIRKYGRTVKDSRTGTKLRRMDLSRIKPGGGEAASVALNSPVSLEDADFAPQSQLVAYGADAMRNLIIRSSLTADELRAKLGASCTEEAGCVIEKISDDSYRVVVPFDLVEQLTGEGSLEQKLENTLGGDVKVFRNRLNKPLVNNSPTGVEEIE